MAKKRKLGEGTLRLRNDGRWEGRVVTGYDDKGYPITKNVTSKDKKVCMEKLEELKKEYGTVSTRCKPDMPFGEWIDFWYKNFCKPGIRLSTQSHYENHIYDHIIPDIGKIPLNELSQADLQQYYSNLKADGRLYRREENGTGLSNAMVRGIHKACHSSLEKAVEEGLIDVNPSKGCKLPPKRSAEMQPLTKEEARRFLAQAKADGDYYEIFILELATGLRIGEVLGLQWADINLDTGEIYIQRQACNIDGNLHISVPKTKGSIRTILLPPSVTNMLKAYKETVNSRWVFPSPKKDDVPRHPTSVRSALARTLKKAECKHVRFHDLRHTFATFSLENGMDFKTLSGILGHESSATTLDIYSHVSDTMRLQAAVSIDRKIGGTNAQMPELEKISEDPEKTPQTPKFEPQKRKMRKRGTGCVTKISENCYEGKYSPNNAYGKRISKKRLRPHRSRVRRKTCRTHKRNERRNSRRESKNKERGHMTSLYQISLAVNNGMGR